MRLRWQRRIRKRLRARQHRDLHRQVEDLERQGLTLETALRTIVTRADYENYQQTYAGKLLSIHRKGHAAQALLDLFFQQADKDDLYRTALRMERLNDRRLIRPLISVLLNDSNPRRRHAAARALGWIHPPCRSASLALAQCLADPSQPQAAREEAAESLHYAGTSETVDVLISVLNDPDVRLRFWAVFGLGGCVDDPRAIRALESKLSDEEVTPGNWWSVGKEALSMLANASDPAGEHYRGRCRQESARILADANSNVDDVRWAKRHPPVQF